MSVATSLFQSTRPRGARRVYLPQIYQPMGFNPRAHAGRDAAEGRTHSRLIVSIHAPTRGATIPFVMSVATSLFQSTRPRGARPEPVPSAVAGSAFQSTRPRGARHNGRCSGVRDRMFQSTRPRGARPFSPCRCLSSMGFNPRAHAGRDNLPPQEPRLKPTFQSTRPRGARLVTIRRQAGRLRFNPRAHAGRDKKRGAKHEDYGRFNPRAHAGRDLYTWAWVSIYTSFNPRAHAGRDPRP